MGRSIEVGEQIIDIEEGADLENEAGAVVWDAALVLIHYIVHSQEVISSNQRVIEVGAGTGAVGLAAAALGVSSVILTDLPHLEDLISTNIARNGLADKASFTTLIWGDSSTSLSPPFDLVLASDVLYQHDWVEPLISTLISLSGPKTVVYLANEHRPKLPFPAPRFTSAGFEVQQVPYAELHPEWRSPDIQLYRLVLA